jgi:hypothetical protein
MDFTQTVSGKTFKQAPALHTCVGTDKLGENIGWGCQSKSHDVVFLVEVVHAFLSAVHFTLTVHALHVP